jgi:predicted Holliday junction resolvase-like endonuclease
MSDLEPCQCPRHERRRLSSAADCASTSALTAEVRNLRRDAVTDSVAVVEGYLGLLLVPEAFFLTHNFFNFAATVRTPHDGIVGAAR